MNKALRQAVFDKYDGHCAYCGLELGPHRPMQVDHIQPLFRGRIPYTQDQLKQLNSIENLNPACGRCNRYKATMSLKAFREEVSKQATRARVKSCNFRIAEYFGLIQETGC